MSDDVPRYVAPTYLLTNVPEFVESITYRMLADGMILQDIRAASSGVETWERWGPFWMERADLHKGHAERSLEAGYRRTAGEHLLRASMCAHYGQFLYFAFPDLKRRLVELKASLYCRAAELFEPAAELVEVPFGETSLPGYLRLPAGRERAPCVVQIGGLDAAKEDAHQFGSLCVARGLATFAFDGPGQGEVLYRGLLMSGDFPLAVRAVIDYLQQRPEIEPDRLGVIGRSTGGFLAPQVAALDARVKACDIWGAMYDLARFRQMPPLIQDGFQFVTGSPDLAAAERAMSFVNLSGLAERITCPVYVLHGGRDNITPPYNAHRVVQEVRGPSKLALYEESIHCNHDVAHVARPDMADWLVERLYS